MTGSIYSWSTTATSNDSADGDINWTEGQNAKTVNNSARQMMGRSAEYRDDQGGLVTVAGTANAITATLNSAFTALADGRHFTLQPASDNTGAVTLNVNGIGAKAIRKFDSTGEVTLASGDLQSGSFYHLIYDSGANSAAGAWIVLNPTAQAQNSKLTDIAALTPTDSNFIVGNGTTWVAETGATVRASLGLATVASTGAYSDLSGALAVGTTSGTVAAGDDSRITGAAQKTDLASTSASKGASLVGVQDSGGNFTATTVETVLAELAADIAALPSPTTPNYGAGNAALSAGGIGTYAWVGSAPGTDAFGSTRAGSSLLPAGVSDPGSGLTIVKSATALTGTWRCMGWTNTGNSFSLYLRIS